MLVLALAVVLVAPVRAFAPGMAPLRGACPPGEGFGESGLSKPAGVVCAPCTHGPALLAAANMASLEELVALSLTCVLACCGKRG